ncbi:ankyrin-2-like [Lineus longissimus]|uniref:ankyrin-2-like n=1 Tax=Lineus longissimus TaxID=88925 RepID=UPI00315CF81D
MAKETGTSIKCPALIKACRMNCLEEVNKLLAAGASANCIDQSSKGRVSALMTAITSRNVDMVKSLLKGGADVNLKSKGRTALTTAITSGGSAEMFEILLKSGASSLERWFLPCSCKMGFFDIARCLLDIGVDVDVCYETTTPLILTAKSGHFETAQRLLERCDVSFERQGERALIETCAAGNFNSDNYKDIINILLRQNLDVNYINEKGKTAIYEAAFNGRGGEKVVRLLLDHGALVEVDTLIGICDPDFELYLSSPLPGAVRHGNIDTVRLLLNLGANVNQLWHTDVDCYSVKIRPGTTEISMLMLASRYGYLNIVKELLDRGGDVHLRNSAGNTALHVAVHPDFCTLASRASQLMRCPWVASKAEPEIIAELLRNGSDATAKNQYGETPLDMCVQLILLRDTIGNTFVSALLYLLKASSTPVNSQEVLSKLWDNAKKATIQTQFHILRETIRVVVAAGLKPTPQLTQVSDHESLRSPLDPSLQREVLVLQDWLNHYSKNATPLSHLCRTRVRASLNLPLKDVKNESLGLSVALRRFLIMDDIDLFIIGHPELQLLQQSWSSEFSEMSTETKSGIQSPALVQACRKGKLEEVDALLELSADVNFVDSKRRGETALMIAVKNGNVDIVSSLLKGGADVNLETKRGTALKTAVTVGSPVMCRILLERGGPSKLEGWFLSYCCKNGFLDVAQVLLEFGVNGDICISQNENTTPLIVAARNGNFELVRLLLERCDVNFERQGERALIATCAVGNFLEDSREAQQTYKPILDLLLGKNLDVNYINEKSKTAMIEAALNSRGGENVVKTLLDHGALFTVDSLVDVCDSDDFVYNLCSPLVEAVKHGDIDMVRLLLDLGANVNEIWRKDVCPYASKYRLGGTDISMLMLASRYACPNIAKELLDRGADVNLRNSAGNTALHIAVHSDFRTLASRLSAPRTRYSVMSKPRPRPEIIRKLLQNGSSVAAKNQNGETPLDICMTMNLATSPHFPRISNDNLLALVYLLKADQKCAIGQNYLSKMWDTTKSSQSINFDILEETIRVVVAAGVKPTLQLIQASDHESEVTLERKVKVLQEWLNHCSKNASPLRDLCRIKVRAFLRSPLTDVQNESLGLPDLLRRFLIMDDLELFVPGHPELQLLNRVSGESN